MTTIVNLRNYFFPVAQSVRLAEGLFGELVYVEHQLGAKTSNTPQCGLFLFRSDHESVDMADDRFMQEEYAMFESWWQADISFDAPFETKVQTFREMGVLWLDNDALSLYILIHSQHPDKWYLRNEYSCLESWFANHDCQKTQHMVEHYLAALCCERPEYKMLHDYVETIFPNLYADILNHIATHLVEMYHDKLTTIGLLSTDGYLAFLANLVHTNLPTWWQCYDQSVYTTSPYRNTVRWQDLSVETVIIGMLAALYWREHPDFTTTARIPAEAAKQPLPVSTREWLWNAYLSVQSPRLYDAIINDDACAHQPTLDEIKRALLHEELQKHFDLSSYPYELSRRVTLFRNQFLTFLGATEADLSPVPAEDPRLSILPEPHEASLSDYQALVDMLEPAGFFSLPKVSVLSPQSQLRLIQKLQTVEPPFRFAIVHHLEWLPFMKTTLPAYRQADKRARYFAHLFDMGERVAKGYINVLNPSSKEDHDRYNTCSYLSDAESFYTSLL